MKFRHKVLVMHPSTAFLLAACLSTASSFAQKPWLIARFSASTAKVYAAASRVTPPTGAGVLVLNQEETYVFDRKGRCIYTEYMIYKVLRQESVPEWDGMVVYWQPWRGNKPVLKARVITPDLVAHKLDPKTIVDAAAQNEQSNIYSDERVMRAPLPAVAPGSVVETEVMMKLKPADPTGGFGERSDFGMISAPVENRSLTIRAPSSIPIHYVLQDLPHLRPQRVEKHWQVKLVFQEGPIAPLHRAESYLPSDVPGYPAVVFSTADSWQAVSDGYRRIVNSRIRAADLQSVVRPIVQGKTSRRQKIDAITQYVDKEIRYTGVEFGSAAVVPQMPTTTLAHRYGDCKDKATLLAAMLRTGAGIPAYVALLDAGERLDLSPDLPSMDFFDHAIVYVPGRHDLWIDATNRFARPSQTPIWDQGRWALIARRGTPGLVRIPELPANENVLLGSRVFHLSEYGPSRVVETDRPQGVFESEYRRVFATEQTKDVHSNLSSYMKSQFLATKLDRVTHSNPFDLSRSFQFILESDKAKRGYTSLNNAVVAIRLKHLFRRLPHRLQRREKDESSGASKPNSKKQRTADYQLPAPFVAEWNYKIIPPPGFEPEPLPQSVNLALGPARFTETFQANPDGIVRAKIRFDSVKRRFTVAEAEALRNQVAQLLQEQPIEIDFEPIGQALANQGKERQAIQSYQKLIALHPKEAVLHLRLAETLLRIGLGETARAQARKAVTLDPSSAIAEKTLANILEHDIVGRNLRRGSDYAGAQAAFRAAIKLDPADKANVANLAILLEYNRWGLRYGPGADLKAALAEYHQLTPTDLQSLGVGDNPAFAEFYDRQFAAALDEAKSLNPEPAGLIGACEAVLYGTRTALHQIRELESGNSGFKSAAETAGDMLANLRMYSIAADLEEAGASGETASDTEAYAALYRQTKPNEQIRFSDGPKGLAERFTLLESNLNLTLGQLNSICSRYGKLTIATAHVRNRLVKEEKREWISNARQGDFPEVGLDLSITRAQPRVQGNDALGYKVVLWPFADYKESVYIVKEQGQYTILATSKFPAAIGLEILDRLAHHDVLGARQLLDWLRDDEHLEGGDDPLAGLPFPRFWTKGQYADPATMKIAAAAILTQSKVTAHQGIVILATALRTARDGEMRTNIRLALANGFDVLDKYADLLTVAQALARRYPESKIVFDDETFCLRMQGKFKQADRLAQARLERLPDDHDALQQKFLDASSSGDHALAHALAQKMVEEGIADPNDLNETAWQSLFIGEPSASDLQDAIKAAQLSGDDFPALHTLACVLAATGDVKQAHEILVQAMDSANLDEPDSNCWLALGLIAERSGERAAAIADYIRVKKRKTAVIITDTSYALAQMHLKALRSNP